MLTLGKLWMLSWAVNRLGWPTYGQRHTDYFPAHRGYEEDNRLSGQTHRWNIRKGKCSEMRGEFLYFQNETGNDRTKKKTTAKKDKTNLTTVWQWIQNHICFHLIYCSKTRDILVQNILLYLLKRFNQTSRFIFVYCLDTLYASPWCPRSNNSNRDLKPLLPLVKWTKSWDQSIQIHPNI